MRIGRSKTSIRQSPTRRPVPAGSRPAARAAAIDPLVGVGVDAEGVARQPLPGVRQPDHAPATCPSGGIVIAEPAARSLRGPPDERVDIAIAADHAIEGDQVGRLDLRGERDEVPVPERHPIGEAAPLGLRAGRVEVRPRGVDVGRRRGAPLQEQLVDRADPAADVEDRPSLDAAPRERVGKRPGGAPRTLAPVLAQLALRRAARRTRRRSSSCSSGSGMCRA